MERVGKRRLVLAGGGVLLLILCALIIFLLARSNSPIPKNISQQLNFVTLLPDSDVASIDKTSVKYDSSQKTMTFIARQEGANITVTEQSTPESFVDVPQAYDTLVNSLNNYSSFDSVQGTVSLTKPKELKGQQTAVMNSKGVLIFAHPTNKNLNDDQWKKFFNSLTLTK